MGGWISSIKLMNKVARKLGIAAASAVYLINAAVVYAQGATGPTDRIRIDTAGIPGYKTISDFLNAGIRFIFIIALLAVLIYLIWGAFDWIISGGDKEAVKSARSKIVNALIGLAILAVAVAIVQLAGTFVGINLFGDLVIPRPTNPTPTLPSQ